MVSLFQDDSVCNQSEYRAYTDVMRTARVRRHAAIRTFIICGACKHAGMEVY